MPDGPLGGPPDNQRLCFERKQSVEVLVRHTRSRPHKRKARNFRKCPCPKYLYTYKDRAASRVSAKSGSWVQAEKKAQEVRDSWVPELPELKRLRAEKAMGRLRIEEAIGVYLEDMRTRNQATLTVANARSLFQSETNSLSMISWVARRNSGREDAVRLVWLDQLDGTALSRWRSEWRGAPLTLRNRWSRVVSFFNRFFPTGKLQRHPCMGLRNFSAQEDNHALHRSAVRTSFVDDRKSAPSKKRRSADSRRMASSSARARAGSAMARTCNCRRCEFEA